MIEPTPLKAGDTSVLVSGKPLMVDFRIISEANYQELMRHADIETTRKSLAMQHKNTRHDAVDKMLEIRARWAEKFDFHQADSMFDEITGAIMNLKQRIP